VDFDEDAVRDDYYGDVNGDEDEDEDDQFQMTGDSNGIACTRQDLLVLAYNGTIIAAIDLDVPESMSFMLVPRAWNQRVRRIVTRGDIVYGVTRHQHMVVWNAAHA
jgi:hypothetical protein